MNTYAFNAAAFNGSFSAGSTPAATPVLMPLDPSNAVQLD